MARPTILLGREAHPTVGPRRPFFRAQRRPIALHRVELESRLHPPPGAARGNPSTALATAQGKRETNA
jgi:hypothetical protein